MRGCFSALAKPSMATIGRRVKVMVSSSQSEFTDLRATIRQELLRAGYEPLLFETSGAIDESAESAAFHLVEECDVYIGILGTQSSSPTLAEFNRASDLGRPRLVFVREGESSERTELLERFLGTDADDRKYGKFKTAVDLSSELLLSLSRCLANQLDTLTSTAAAELEGLEASLEQLLVGSKLLQASNRGRLDLRVEGALRAGERSVVLIGTDSRVALPAGLEMDLCQHGGDAGEVMGGLVVEGAKVGDSTFTCTFHPTEHRKEEWESFAQGLDDGAAKELPWGVFVRLHNEEQFRNVQSSMQRLVYSARRRVGA